MEKSSHETMPHRYRQIIFIVSVFMVIFCTLRTLGSTHTSYSLSTSEKILNSDSIIYYVDGVKSKKTTWDKKLIKDMKYLYVLTNKQAFLVLNRKIQPGTVVAYIITEKYYNPKQYAIIKKNGYSELSQVVAKIKATSEDDY